MQCAACRGLAAADHVRDSQGAQAALSMTSTFAKEHRVDFLGLPLSLQRELQSMSCSNRQGLSAVLLDVVNSENA